MVFLIKPTLFGELNIHHSLIGTYHATDPKTWFEHELGLLSCDVISSHLLRAHGHNRSKRTRPAITADRPVVQRVETANDVTDLISTNSTQAADSR